MAVGDRCRAVIHTRLHGQTCLNVLHFRAMFGAATVAGLGASIRNNLIPLLANASSTQRIFEKIELTVFWPQLMEATEEDLQNVTGNLAGESLPGTVAAVLSLRTGFGGRRYRGRMFHPGLPESHHADGMLNAAGRTVMNAIAANLQNATSAGPGGVNWRLGIYSRTIANQGPTHDAEFAFNLVTRCAVNDILGTMRSRKIGRGI